MITCIHSSLFLWARYSWSSSSSSSSLHASARECVEIMMMMMGRSTKMEYYLETSPLSSDIKGGGGGRYSEEGEGTCALAAFDGCTSLFELLALRLGPSPFWGHHRRAEPSQPPSTETSLLLCASPVYVARHAKKVVATAVAAGKNAMYERHRAASNNDYDDDDGQGTKCIRSVACAYRDVGWNLIRKFFPWSFNLKSSIVVKDLINLLFSITEKIWQWNKKI